MDESANQQLIELKDFMLGQATFKRDPIEFLSVCCMKLFEILCLMENQRPGVYFGKEFEKQLKVDRNFSRILSWFDIMTSMRHGKYCTKEKGIYKKWNKIFFFDFDKHYFLGHPSCCTNIESLELSGITLGISFYSLVKELKEKHPKIKLYKSRDSYYDIQIDINALTRQMKSRLWRFFNALGFVDHVPCSIYCTHTINLGEKFRNVWESYKPLIRQGLLDSDFKMLELMFDLAAKDKLVMSVNRIDKLGTLDKEVVSNLLGINSFKREDVVEILNKGEKFQSNITDTKNIIKMLYYRENI